MLQRYRKKVLVLLLWLLFLFAFTFIVSLLNPSFNFMDVGLSNEVENKIISLFSFFSILLILWDLHNL